MSLQLIKKAGKTTGAILFAASVLLSACSKQPEQTPSAASPSAAPSASGSAVPSVSQQEPLALSIFAPTYGGNLPDPNGAVWKEIEKRSNTKLKVTWVPINDWESRLNVGVASNDLPDLVVTKNPPGQFFSANVAQAIKNGQFHDLTPYIAGDPSFKTKYPNLGNYPEQIWENDKFNGKIYGFPWGLSPVSFLSGHIVRKDLFDKAGLKVPTTVDELADVMIKLSSAPDVYGMQFSNKSLDNSNIKPIAVAFTGVQDWGVDAQGNFQYQAFMPEYKDFLRWVKKLYDAKAIEQEFSLGQLTSNFQKGKAAVMLSTWWNGVQTPTNRYFAQEAPQEATTMHIMPVKGPKAYAIGIQPGFSNPVLVNAKFDKAKMDRLLKAYDYFASPEFYDLVTNGLEGIHHKVENGKKVPIPDKIAADGLGSFSAMLNAVYRDFAEEARKSGASDETVKQLQAIAAFSEAKTKEAGITVPQWKLTSPTYMSKWTALIKDLDDNRTKVVMGKMSFDDWDKFVLDVTSSDAYRQILQEFKADYSASKK
ncbi:MAG: extracellular solute-binding protein [Paenibacillaceae bacterium]|nr:extracellular solute-binding protein [Paenibacillaceae bacterium]